MSGTEPSLAAFLQSTGLALAGERAEWTPLSGGVSSDIWRVTTSTGTFCVKRALAQLKVAADWKAPVSRNAFEWRYMQLVSEIAPGSVPTPIAHDPAAGLFAMEWLGPEGNPLWKTRLFEGHVDPAFSAQMGTLLGRIHAATARDPLVPAQFATDESFAALRIEPYLRTVGAAHPDLAPLIDDIADEIAGTHLVLVHGDVSPKNILCGAAGPVLLDAECAWFGDPAFDLAFCLNHLAIKARILPGVRDALVASFHALADAYLALVDWEAPAGLERRAARLLPALALARVDGKSPVEYLDDDQRVALRRDARHTLVAEPANLHDALALLNGVSVAQP